MAKAFYRGRPNDRPLPANTNRHWRVVLELPDLADAATIEAMYKRLAKERHPDKNGGDAEPIVELNRAHREALEELQK